MHIFCLCRGQSLLAVLGLAVIFASSGVKGLAMSSDSPKQALTKHAISWAASSGLQVGRGDNPPRFTHVPFSLLPQALPQDAFVRAQNVAPTFGTLVHRVSQDSTFLKESLAEVCESDDFTRSLVDLMKTVEAEGGSVQRAALGILRSDYMLHDPSLIGKAGDPVFLQVELNTIASSFGCLSARVAQLHCHLLQRFGPNGAQAGATSAMVDAHFANVSLAQVRGGIMPSRDEDGSPATKKARPENALASAQPPNPSLEKLPAALHAAWAHYNAPNAAIVFVVQDGETNVMDQRLLEFQVFENYGIPVHRLSLGEIQKRCSLSEDGKRRLYIDGAIEVAVVYFRAGYTPNDYPTEAEWEARLKIEQSYAIKCPNIGYHLTGTKKVQQVLTSPKELARFLSPEESEQIFATFAGLYSLGSDAGKETEAAVAECRKNPDLYVLKPQREGGGNNLYGQDIIDKLDGCSPQELQEFVLMERFFPRAQEAVLVREGEAVTGPAVSELGIYSTLLAEGDTVLLNDYAGYLLRTKLEDVKEGGVATGYAVLSSPVLTL